MRAPILALSLSLLAAAPACGDGDEPRETITCAALGGLLAEQLVSVGCGPGDLGLLIDFAWACGTGSPTREEAESCLVAAYDLESCPRDLPVECGAFAAPVYRGDGLVEVDVDGDGKMDTWMRAESAGRTPCPSPNPVCER